MEAMQNAITAVTTPAVQMWMNWMLVIFAASLLFVWKHTAARYALGAFVLSAVLGLLIFTMTGEPFLIGLSHILVWGPLAVYLYRTEYKRPGFRPKTVYGVWVLLLLATIVISLVFDVRDVALILLDSK